MLRPLSSLSETCFYVLLFFVLFQLCDVLWEWSWVSVAALIAVFGVGMALIKKGPFEKPR